MWFTKEDYNVNEISLFSNIYIWFSFENRKIFNCTIEYTIFKEGVISIVKKGFRLIFKPIAAWRFEHFTVERVNEHCAIVDREDVIK